MRLIKLVVVVSLIAFSGCDKKSPVAPTAPAVNTTGLVINGLDTVLTGVPTNYTVTASLSDGTTATVTPVWGTDDPALASIDSTGRLEGRRHGSTTVTAAYDGRTTTRIVHVVANYSGTWKGTMVIRACTDSGELNDRDGGWCRSGGGRVGSRIENVTMTLVQSAPNLSEIAGTWGNFLEPIAGVVTADGRLSLAGTFANRAWWDDPTEIYSSVEVHGWDSQITAPDEMTGHFSEHLNSLYPRRGTADMEFEIITMTRTAATPSLVRAK